MKLLENHTENVGERGGRQDRSISCRIGSSFLYSDRTYINAVLFPAYKGSVCEEQQPNKGRSFTVPTVR